MGVLYDLIPGKGISPKFVIKTTGTAPTVTNPDGSSTPVNASGVSNQWECEVNDFGVYTITVNGDIKDVFVYCVNVYNIDYLGSDEWHITSLNDEYDNSDRRERFNITSRILADNGVSLITAIAEQNLSKYGYSIGDYFESPTDRTLTNETFQSSTLTQTDISVKVKYHLADMNTFYGGYNNGYAVVDIPHIGIVVDSGVNRQWNAAALTNGEGYESSKLHTFLKGTTTGSKNKALMYVIQQDINDLFGTYSNHLIKLNKLYTKYVVNGSNYYFSWGWQDSTPSQNEYISALTEMQMYGSTIWSGKGILDTAHQDGYEEGEAIRQLELFRKYSLNEIYGNSAIWLRSLYSGSYACNARHDGYANYNSLTRANRASGLILLH